MPCAMKAQASGLVAAIDEYVAHHKTKPKPVIWTKSAADTLEKVAQANARFSFKQSATLLRVQKFMHFVSPKS